MRFIDAATLQGDGSTNQDRYLVGDYYAAVLDGASAYPPEPEGRDGGWYAEKLAAALQSNMTPDLPLTQVLVDALDQLNTAVRIGPGGPSSTVAMIRWCGGNLDCLVLGDSTISVTLDDGTVHALSDRRLDGVGAAERRAYRHRLAAGSGFDQRHHELLGQLQTVQRNHRNRRAGYWIASDTPQAAERSITKRFTVAKVRSAVLMTDGASAAVDRFEKTTWADVSSQLRASGCAAFLDRVRDLENSDPGGQRVPRSKHLDDKTVVLWIP